MPALMRADWYDFPAWYDILHTPGTAREVDGLSRIARRFVGPSARAWLEPACGTGRYLRVAAGRGCRVAGFDLNPRMIDYTRASLDRRGLAGEVFVADMTTFRVKKPGTFDLAFCTINSVRHLHSDDAMLAHLAAVARALSPRGVYALGMETTIYGGTFPTEDVWSGTRGRVHVRQLVQYLPPTRARRMEHVASHLTITTPTDEKHLESTYDLRAYDLTQWTALLDLARWDVVALCDADGNDALRTPKGGPVGGYALWVIRPRPRRRASLPASARSKPRPPADR